MVLKFQLGICLWYYNMTCSPLRTSRLSSFIGKSVELLLPIQFWRCSQIHSKNISVRKSFDENLSVKDKVQSESSNYCS